MFQEQISVDVNKPTIGKSAFSQFSIFSPAVKLPVPKGLQTWETDPILQRTDLTSATLQGRLQQPSNSLWKSSDLSQSLDEMRLSMGNMAKDKKNAVSGQGARTQSQESQSDQRNQNMKGMKSSWTKEEDEELRLLVDEKGAKNWSLIAKHLSGRIGKQCRERWHNHLNPEINKKKWTEEEDQIIIQCHQKFGNKWALISKYLPGRTDNAIKNHWNSTICRRMLQSQALHPSNSENISNSYFTPQKNMLFPSLQFKTAYSVKLDLPPLQLLGSERDSLVLSSKKLPENGEVQPENGEVQAKQNSKIAVVIPTFSWGSTRKKQTSSSFFIQKISQLCDWNCFIQ